MKQSSLIGVLFLLLFATSSKGQIINSLKQKLKTSTLDTAQVSICIDIARYYLNRNLDSCTIYTASAIKLADNIKASKLKASILLLRGELALANGDFDLADTLLHASLSQAKAFGNVNQQYKALIKLGFLALIRGVNPEAKIHYNAAFHLAKEMGFPEKMAEASAMLGRVSFIEGNYDEAFKSMFDAIPALEKSKDKTALAIAYSSIGLAYRSYGLNNKAMDEIKKSIEYQEKANAIYRETGNTTDLAKGLGNLGGHYGIMGNLDKSLALLKEALTLAQATRSHLIECDVISDIGNVYFMKKDYAKAKSYYEQVRAFLQETSNLEDLAANNMNLGLTASKMKDFQLSVQYLKEALVQATDLDHKRMREAALKSLSVTYEEMGNYKDAYLLQKQRQFLRDSLQKADKDKAIAEFELKYETVKKEQDIALKAATINRQRTGLLLGLTLLALALTFAIVFFRQKKTIQNKNQNLSLLNLEIQHRTKNYLQILGGIFTLQSLNTTDEAQLRALEEGRSRVDAMKLLEQKLLNTSFSASTVNVGEYLSEVIDNLSHALPAKSRFFFHKNLAFVQLDITKAMSLGIIVNELLMNATKHTTVEKPEATITLLQEDQIKLIVEDNGEGLPENYKALSGDAFGLRLVSLFADRLGANITVSNAPGARFELVFN